MLLLRSTTFTVDGIEIYADHADPNQFWYLPGPVALARKGPDKVAAFTFIEFKPAAVAGGAKGRGFLMFEVDLHLERSLEQRILAKVSGLAPGTPRPSPVPFDEGTAK